MGYYTTYSMTVHNVKDKEQFDALCESLDAYGILRYALDSGSMYEDTAEFCSYNEVKWYEHEEDMKDISKKFPDMVFQLRGYGEDPEDIWEKYFKYGDCEECIAQVIIPKPERIKWD